jgi:hypothetical protein
VIDESKTMEVAIESGVPHEHDYIFTGESDEYVKIIKHHNLKKDI